MIRQCPLCSCDIVYVTLKKFRIAERQKRTCRSCSAKAMWQRPSSQHTRPETRSKISQSVKALHLVPGYTQRIVKAWVRAAQSTKVSKLELSVKRQLNSLGFLHSTERKEQFIGPYIPDYVNYDNKIIVEVYGDYWHANPKRYAADDYVYTDQRSKVAILAKDRWSHDADRVSFYENTVGTS